MKPISLQFKDFCIPTFLLQNSNKNCTNFTHKKNFQNFFYFYFFFFLFYSIIFSHSTRTIKKNSAKNFNFTNIKTNIDDNASWSQANGAIQTKLDFNLYLDMNNKKITGFVRFHYKCLSLAKFVALDVNGLQISKVLNPEKNKIKFIIKKNLKNSIGDALIIFSEEICLKKENYLDIYYSTHNALGVHFSHPETLHNKNYTFLYTHAEAIYGRTFFPAQDSPSLKVKLSANITVDDPYTALFSGKLISSQKIPAKKQTQFFFEMENPIPTYLITFAAGNLVRKQIPNSRCEVYGEEQALKYVNESFKFCEEYLKFYETYKKFFMDKMVFLITPHDYPFSGMENPYVTVIAESVLSKDRSFTSTISHEIAHFWSGNLVTNKNWGSFWLNEGITTYLTRKSFRKIHGEDLFSFEMFMGLFKLDNAIDDMKKDSKFDPSVRSLSPIIMDDPYKSFSRIPYEKGSFFMYYLETLLGDDIMHKIMSDYFNEFAYQSIDTEKFINFLKEKMKKYLTEKNFTEIIKKVEWEKWLKGTEKLPVEFNFKSKTLEIFKEKIELIKNGNMTVESLTKMLKPMRLIEKAKILKELLDKFGKLNENTKSSLKNLVEKNEIFGSHKVMQAAVIIFKANFIENADERVDYLIKSLKEFKFYKVLHVKKVFGMIKEKKSDKVFLKKVLKDISERLNPITVARIDEFIDIKPKKN